MATNYEAPVQVRELEKKISGFTYRNGFEMSRVFDDWLLFIIYNFLTEPAPIEGWHYKPEQNRVFHELMIEWFQVMHREVQGEKVWFDAFGCLYEALIASNSRRQNAGQFFTPEPVCDLMTRITGNADNMTGKGLMISDPTCGSGRTLLSFHIQAPGNYVCGEDIDRTCCLMTVCNFLIHGAVGEVVWHDSLNPDSWYDGWKVNANLNNPFHRFCGLPHVQKIDKEQSFVYKSWQQHRLKAQDVKAVEPAKVINIKDVNQQLSLF